MATKNTRTNTNRGERERGEVSIPIRKVTVRGRRYASWIVEIFGREYFVNFGKGMHDVVDVLKDGEYTCYADPHDVFIAPQIDSDKWVNVVIMSGDIM